MGSKLTARGLMANCGVPVLPGEDLTGVTGRRSGAVADRVGWPVWSRHQRAAAVGACALCDPLTTLADAVAGGPP